MLVSSKLKIVEFLHEFVKDSHLMMMLFMRWHFWAEKTYILLVVRVHGLYNLVKDGDFGLVKWSGEVE